MNTSQLPRITQDAYRRLAELTSTFGDLLRDSVIELAIRTGGDQPITPALVDQAAVVACERFNSQHLTQADKTDQHATLAAA